MRCAGLVVMGGIIIATIAERSRAEIVQVKADLTSTVREFEAGTATQSDIAAASFPGTSTLLPLPAIATLTGLDVHGNIDAAGRAVTIFNNAQASAINTPDDFGMDLAGFSLGNRSWIVEGSDIEHRTIRLTPAEAGAPSGQKVQARSTLFLSGVLVLSSTDATRDMTDALAQISFRISRQGADGSSDELLTGLAALAGGPGGDVARVISGAVNPSFKSVITLDGVVPQLPLLRALLFSAVIPTDSLTYQYEAVVDEPFDLVLEFRGRLVTLPDGVGAAVVFGLPQEGFDQVFQQVGGSTANAGKQAQDTIRSLVDTTGHDRPDVGTVITPLPTDSALPLCGAMGAAPIALGMAAFATRWGVRRRRRRGP